MLHDRTGVPFTVQLGRELARRNYDILYSYGAFFQSPKGNLVRQETDPSNFQIEAMQLNKPFQKYSFIKRRFQEIEYAHLLVQQIEKFDPDMTILCGSHPDALSVVYKKCKSRRMVFWVQDIYGVAIKRILSNRFPIVGDWIGNYYMRLEKQLLHQSDHIILISADFMDLMNNWGIDPSKIDVIHNWTPIEELPVRPKYNAWSVHHQLTDKFCILYAGTLGLKHNPEILLRLALHFKLDDQVRIVVISEGLGADWLRKKKEELSVENLLLLDFQLFKNMPDVLGTADVLLAILEPDAGIYSAPSKVLTYLCAERAILLAIPPENLSARIVSENDAGLVVHPTEIETFVAAAQKLRMDTALRQKVAQNAREYAENNFDIVTICDRFEKIILQNKRMPGTT